MSSMDEHSPRGGEVVRREFGGNSIERRAETAVSAAAAQARAAVEAMYVMALQRPRDIVEVRERLLAECRRKGFAESAVYHLPRGGKTIEGPSIRFAEAGLRALGNAHVRTTITYEDDERRVGEVTVIDLERNTPLSASFTIDKTVERKSIKGGEAVLGERTNSSGLTVYRVAATEADVLMKQEAIVARLRRNLILQLLPGDLRDEALELCERTLVAGDGADPRATAKKIGDSFNALGIGAAQLREYLGHPVDQVTPEEAKDLRGVYSAIKDGQTTWSEVVESRRGGADATPAQTAEEKSERAGLLRSLADHRVKDSARYDFAMREAGIATGIPATSLSLDVLRKVAGAMAANQATGETSSDTARQVVDDYFRDPPAK